MVLKCFFNDLGSGLINFVCSRDPVGEKTTKIGTYKGGRRPKAAAPILVVFSPTGSLSLSKLIRLLLKSRTCSFQSLLACRGAQKLHFGAANKK